MGKGCEGTFWGDENVQNLDTNVGYMGVIFCQNSLNVVTALNVNQTMQVTARSLGTFGKLRHIMNVKSGVWHTVFPGLI